MDELMNTIGFYDEYDDEEEYDVGAVRRPVRKRGATRVRIPYGNEEGIGVVWPLPITALVTLAAGATGTMTFTPNRNVYIRRFMFAVYTAAAITRDATYPEAIKITGLTVMGRSQLAGTGEIPLSAFLPSNPDPVLPVMLNCDSTNSILVTLRNDDAATTHVVTGMIWVTTVKD